MTDRRSSTDRRQRVCLRQANTLRRVLSLYAMALVATAAFVVVATGPGYPQSETVRESNELLKDILRKRDLSEPDKGGRKTTPAAKSPTRKRARESRPAQSHGRFVGRWRLDADCTTGHYIITANIKSATATDVSGSTSSTSGFGTTILDGKVTGNTIRFRRRTKNSLIKTTDTVTGHLAGASRMTGDIRGGIGSCRFTATR